MVEITLNPLAKKLSGEEGGAKNKQRVIHDLAANGLESNPYFIDERAQWYKKLTIRSENKRCMQDIIQKSD